MGTRPVSPVALRAGTVSTGREDLPLSHLQGLPQLRRVLGPVRILHLPRDPGNPTSGTSKPDLCLTESRDNLQEPRQASHQVATDKLPPLRIKPALVLTRSTRHLGHETGASGALSARHWALSLGPPHPLVPPPGRLPEDLRVQAPVAGPRLRTASCRLASTRPERSLVLLSEGSQVPPDVQVPHPLRLSILVHSSAQLALCLVSPPGP